MIKLIYVDISSVDAGMYKKIYDLVDAQRKARADRYLRFEDKVRCVAAGALLRYAVKRWCNRDFFEVDTDANGKPFIKDAAGFHINLSHAGKWVVIACGDTPVGIDVEKIDPTTPIEQIASRFFSPGEQTEALISRERFFEIWTCKESYVKYMGKGLQMGLRSFSVRSVKDVRFSPVEIDPMYRLTLCADQGPDEINQLHITHLIDTL